MDCYMWVDPTTSEGLLIPISDEAETYLTTQLSGIEERTNTSILSERTAYLLPESGDNYTRFHALITTVCSHVDENHRTCVNDPNCDERLRLVSQAPADKKNP